MPGLRPKPLRTASGSAICHFLEIKVLHQFHCDFSRGDGEFGFSTVAA
jgi:hypothetical protein